MKSFAPGKGRFPSICKKRLVLTNFLISFVFLTFLLIGFRVRAESGAQTETRSHKNIISADWLSQVQADLRKREYEVNWQEKPQVKNLGPSYHAVNRAQGFRTYFTPSGIVTIPRVVGEPEWSWVLNVKAWGWQGHEHKIEKGVMAVNKNQLQLKWDGFEMRFVNSPDGLTQEFAMDEPMDRGGAKIVIDMDIGGNLLPRYADNGRSIAFFDRHGRGVIHYRFVKALDHAGLELPVRIKPRQGGFRIVIDTRTAVFPITIENLTTSYAWMGESNQASAYYGISVASAGDVNGDGYDDVIVGAYYYDNGQPLEGAAFVYLGSASGLSTTYSWMGEGNKSSAEYGTSVASAGDVNGDGYSDVIVGAPYYYHGELQEGVAFLYLGSASGLSKTFKWLGESNQTYARFGTSVASAGDVNGDGYSDVIIGAPYYDNGQTDEGVAFIYLGTSYGLSSTYAWRGESNQASAWYGFSVASAGDVNGDGYSDVIIGSTNYDNGQTDEGRAYVYLGSPTGVSATPIWTGEGNQVGASFGYAVALAGDVNGDGYSDIIVGVNSYDAGQTDEGRALVYLGSATGVSTSPIWSGESNQASAYYGTSVASAGDINGDGYSDFIIGADFYDNTFTDEGKVYVYLGDPNVISTTPVWTNVGNQSGAHFGRSVASAGDVNGDGYSDIIIGSHLYDNGETDEGSAFVYLGSAGGLSTTANWTNESNQASAQFGYSVASAGDVNGDGYSDVIVGANTYDNGQTDEGAVFIYLGSSTGLSTTSVWMGEGNQSFANYGLSVASAGDVNGDGYSDIIIGAPLYANGQTNEGGAFVYLGSSSGLSSTPAWVGEGNQAGAQYGWSVSSAGDVNGDGYADVIVGSIYYDNGQTNEGSAYVYLGSSTGLSNTASWTGESNQSSAQYGFSVASAGDVNGDGYSDIIVGAPFYSNGQTNEGIAYVYYGSATGLSTAYDWWGESNQASARYGWSVASAGDVNGDGYSDVIVGASYYSKGQSNEGVAFVYYGSATGLSTAYGWLGESNQASAQYGVSVASAGDVNGDGYSDVIVGADQYNNGQSNEGVAFLYFGSASGLSTTADWMGESNQASANYGISVASAGDVNGDGYADVIVGADQYDNGQSNEGRAFLYYGNESAGYSAPLWQMRADLSAPIAPLGSAYQAEFQIKYLLRSPFGRSKVKIQWQVLPLHFQFHGNTFETSSFWLDSFTSGRIGIQHVYLPSTTGPFIWRARAYYHPTMAFPQSHGPWRTLMANALTETDLIATTNSPPPPCVPPDEPVWIYQVTTSTDGNNYPILHFQDPNQPDQVTGYHIRRSDNSALPKSTWPLVATNVTDMDAGTPNIQWTDTSGDAPPSGTWYYVVTAFNAHCGSEGPF